MQKNKMKFIKVLSILILTSGCINTIGNYQENKEFINANPLLTESVSMTTLVSPTFSQLPSSTFQPTKHAFYESSELYQVELDCEIYTEISEYKSIEEWDFLAPTFNKDGDVFFADPANNTILIYPAGENYPKIVFVSEEFGRGIWQEVSVTQDYIYLPFPADGYVFNIAILTYSGEEVDRIELPRDSEYNNKFSTHRGHSLLLDDDDIFVVLDPDIWHLDNDTQVWMYYEYLDGIPFIESWDGYCYYKHRYVSDHLFVYNSCEDILKWNIVWSVPRIPDFSPCRSSVLGVDTKGNIYFIVSNCDSEGKIWIVKLNKDDHHLINSEIPEDYLLEGWDSYTYYRLSPTGGIFGIKNRYKSVEDSVEGLPQIIQCEFP